MINLKRKAVPEVNEVRKGFTTLFSNEHETPLLRVDGTGLLLLLTTLNEQGAEMALEILEDQCDLIGAYRGTDYIVQFPGMVPCAYTLSSLQLEIECFLRQSGSLQKARSPVKKAAMAATV